jgi:hypothetical protein
MCKLLFIYLPLFCLALWGQGCRRALGTDEAKAYVLRYIDWNNSFDGNHQMQPATVEVKEVSNTSDSTVEIRYTWSGTLVPPPLPNPLPTQTVHNQSAMVLLFKRDGEWKFAGQ